MNREAIQFSQTPVSRAKLRAAMRRFLGVPYSARRNFIFALGGYVGGNIDLQKSNLNCFGLVLAVAREVGLLPPDFDLSRARWQAGQTLDAALWELLETNFRRVGRKRARVGDVLLMWCHDTNRQASGPHHVAFKSASGRAGNHRGAMIHAVEADESGRGEVLEVPLDVVEWPRVHSVWRLKTLVD